MQRIKPADPTGKAQLTATYERIARTRGYVSNILMSLSHAPDGLEAFAAYGAYVRYGTDLDPRVRELSILGIARGNAYAWAHHTPHALKAGVTQHELDALSANQLDAFGPTDRAAIRYIEEFARGGNVSDATFAELKKHYSDRQITDLTLLAGYFMALGATITAFNVEHEPEFPAK